MKNIIIAMVVLMLVPLVSAEDYSIEDVYINGIEMDSSKEVGVDLGEIIEIQVIIKGLSEEDVKVKAWVGNYDVYYSEMFDVEEGITYSEMLYLELPEDLDQGEYTLHVEVYDNLNKVEKEFTLYVDNDENNKKKVYIRDEEGIIISFESIRSVHVDEEEQFKVMVTNLGDDKEEFYLKVDGQKVDEVVVDSGSSGDLYYTLVVSEEGANSVLVSVYDDQGLLEEKSISFNAEERQSIWVIGVGVLIGMLVVLGIILYLKTLK